MANRFEILRTRHQLIKRGFSTTGFTAAKFVLEGSYHPPPLVGPRDKAGREKAGEASTVALQCCHI